jgi:hypothetical protein
MILTYHELTAAPSRDLYSVSRDRFAEHLRLLSELNLTSVSGEPLQLTFDDGHISNYNYAIPLLDRYSLRGIFFVPAGKLRDADRMNRSQLREMVSKGHRVQSHTWSHALLTACSRSRLKEELRRSRQTLEDELSVPVDSLSVPGGRWDARVLEACAETGYRYMYTSDAWRHPEESSGVCIVGRLMVRGTMDPLELRTYLTATGSALWRLRAPYVARQIAKQVLGYKVYDRIWRHCVHRDGRWNIESSRTVVRSALHEGVDESTAAD